MPELPEVETIRKQLDKITPFEVKKVSYSKVSGSILKEKNKMFNPKGKTISHIKRKGKLLNFFLDDHFHILSHLGMSGSWRISKSKVTEKHTHVQFEGLNKSGSTMYLAYVDPRRFGNMYFVDDENAKIHLDKLGVDISEDDFTTEYIITTFKRFPKRQLKPFLLEQKYFAGIGNYIACEICALAGIRPTRRLEKITKAECEKIRVAALDVINGQIKSQGLTFSGGYTDAFGDAGSGVTNLVVFHQKICGMCEESKTKKIVLAQRGTYYCPSCQK